MEQSWPLAIKFIVMSGRSVGLTTLFLGRLGAKAVNQYSKGDGVQNAHLTEMFLPLSKKLSALIRDTLFC